TRQARAIQMLSDTDPTVRQAAAEVLTPVPSPAALEALVAQLGESYRRLHEATRQALIHPRDPSVRDAVIQIAAKMLDDPDPRRREDASFVLGHLHSDAAIQRHIELLQ